MILLYRNKVLDVLQCMLTSVKNQLNFEKPTGCGNKIWNNF